jgi:Na+-translocating ferredoxin:NAD+ oxidoreductase subunit G
MKKKLLWIGIGAVLGIIVLNLPARGAEPAKTETKATAKTESNPAETLDKGLKKVMSDFDNKPVQEVIYINDQTLASKCDFEKDKGCKVYPGKKKGALLGFAVSWTTVDGMKGPINILLGLTPDGSISGIDVLKHEETKNLGAKITEDEFQKQFLTKNLKNSKLQIEKDGGDIKAITGASFSSRAVTGAVKEALEFYDKNKTALAEKAKGK